MKRRAFIFTLDGVLSIILAVIIITSIVTIETQSQTVYSTYAMSADKYLAEDTLALLKTTPLNELVPPQVISNWISEGVLNTTFVSPRMSPLMIVATYWSLEAKYPQLHLRNKAGEILGFILNTTLKNYNYELIITSNSTQTYNFENPYIIKKGSDYNLAKNVVPATLVISGYRYNQTPRGYMARAYLSKLKAKETTYTYMGDYIATMNDGTGPVKITYIIPTSQFPVDAKITGVEWFLEPAYVDSYYRIAINGKDVTCVRGSTTGWFLVENNKKITDTSGNNPDVCNLVEETQSSVDKDEDALFTAWVDNSQQSGEDGAQHIIINYTTSQASTFTYPHKFYLADVYANDSIYIEKYVFAPGNISDIRIHLEGSNIAKVMAQFRIFNKLSNVIKLSNIGNGVFVADNATIAEAIKSTGYNYKDISGTFFTIMFDVIRESRYNPLHLDGFNSYVYVDYTPFVYSSLYSIDISNVITDYSPQTDGFSRDITWKWNIPEEAKPVYVKFQFPWLYYTGQTCEQKVEILNDDEKTWTTLYYAPDYNNFIYAFARWGYTVDTRDYKGDPVKNALHPGLNEFHLEFGNCYSVQPSNTLSEVLYLLDAYAPYGNIKPKLMQGYPKIKAYNLTYKYKIGNEIHESSIVIGESSAVTAGEYKNITAGQLDPSQYAVDDAILRLFEKLGGDGWNRPILVALSGTKIDFASLRGVPSSISPIMITLRIWGENG